MVWLSHRGFQESGGSITKGQVVRTASRVNEHHPGGATLPSGRKNSHLYLYYAFAL